MTENEKYEVSGMTCASCSAHVSKAVSSLKGVKEVSVNLLTNSMLVTYDSPCSSPQICEAVKKAGYGAKKEGEEQSASKADYEDKETPKLLRRLIFSFILLAPLFYFSMGYMNPGWGWPLGAIGENPFYFGLLEMLLSGALLLINRSFFISGFSSLIHGGPNMDTLVSLGSGIAYLYGIIVLFFMAGSLSPEMGEEGWAHLMHQSMGLTFETAGMVPTLITIGKVLESYSKGKTTNAIRSLMDLSPKQATLLVDGEEKVVPAERVQVGDVFLVRPGEAFPVDGVILKGSSSVDESALSGESAPVDKKEGDSVSSSTINQNGALECRATRVGEETTLRQIVKMVEQASSTKTKISGLADKVSGVFVPVVLSFAVLVFLGWICFGRDYVSGTGVSGDAFSYALERGISVLVVACPCALGLATPVAIMVGSGKGAKNGILFKNASSLEETGKMDFVVLDKTGTLTEGKPLVTDVVPASGFSEESLLSLAAGLEVPSEHPLAKAIVDEAKKRSLPYSRAEAFQALVGAGVEGKIDGEVCYGGKVGLLQGKAALGQKYAELCDSFSQEGKTPLLFAKGDSLAGIIAVSDVLKEDSPQAVEEFKRLGLVPVMLTGDNPVTAEYIAKKAGIDYFKASLLPEEKLQWIQFLKRYGKVAMVGDGINDAPALTCADIGIAIGAGSDVALDSSSVVLMKGSLRDACAAIRLSRHTLLNVKENLFWAFFYNLIMIPIAAGAFSALGLGKLKPWYGALAMALSSVCVVLNALRINFYHLYKGSRVPSRNKANPQFKSLFASTEEKGDTTMEVKEIKVEGMSCPHCVAHVKSALEAVPGVKEAAVSLEKKKAVVTCAEPVADEILVEAIEKAGYKAKMK